MSSKTPTAAGHDFDSDPAPTDKVDATQLDLVLGQLFTRCNELLALIDLLTRSDDTLRDGLIRARMLHAEVLDLLASSAGWQPKAAVACATTANVALTGEQTIDGVLTAASRVLVKNQTAPAENGVYVTGAGAWTRAADADTAAEIGLAYVPVSGGTTQGGQVFVCQQLAAAITLDTTALSFVAVGAVGAITIANGGTGTGTPRLWPTPVRLPVRAVATANVNIASPGASIDSVALSAGDRVLLTAQSTASQNGIMQWNGAASAMTRPEDYPAGGTVQSFANLVVPVAEGASNRGTLWRVTTAGAITIDSTSVAWSRLDLRDRAPFKLAARVAVTSNVNLASPGASLDGVAMSVGDRALLPSQTTPAERGLWVWNGAAAAMTRPDDFPAGGTLQAFVDLLVPIREGTSAGGLWRQTATGAITIDTTAQTWARLVLGTKGGGTGQETYTVGDILAASAVDVLSKVAPNTAAVRKFLRMLGTGAAGALPAWDTLAADDIPQKTPRDAFRGLRMENDSGVPDSRVTFQFVEGVLTNGSGASKLLSPGSSFTANIAASGANGLDAGAEASNTWYHVWCIYNPTTDTTAALLSTSEVNPTMPSGFTFRAYVGAVRNNGSSNFVKFIQMGNDVDAAPVNVFDNQTGVAAFTAQSISSQVPPNAVYAKGNHGSSITAKSGMVIASDANGLGECTQAGGAFGSEFNNFFAAAPWWVNLINSQQVHWKSQDTTASYRMDVTGWGY